jgi:hypothetical protein
MRGIKFGIFASQANIFFTAGNWNIVNLSFVQASSSVLAQDATPTDLFWKIDGDKVYIIGSTNDNIYQYPVSIPFDISTRGALEETFDVSGEEGTPQSLWFKSDGTKLYITGVATDQVYQYPVSTPWDISTAGPVEETLNVSAQDTSPASVVLSPDGRFLYILGNANNTAYQYVLSVPWNISSSIGLDKTFNVSAQGNLTLDISWGQNGRKLYMSPGANGNSRIFQYPVLNPYDITVVGGVEETINVNSEEPIMSGISWNNDGTKLHSIGRDTSTSIHEYKIIPPGVWNVKSARFFGNSFNVGGEDGSPQGMAWGDNGSKFYMIGNATDTIFQYPVSTPYDITTAGSVESSFSIGAQTTGALSLTWNNDGTKLYVIGSGGPSPNIVHQYPVSTAWLVSTAGAVEETFNVSSHDNNMREVLWNNDGTKIYVLGTQNNNFYQFPVTTPFDVSTAGALEATLFVGNEENNPTGGYLKTDGTAIYVTGNQTSNAVIQYELVTPFDIDTATPVQASTFDLTVIDDFQQNVTLSADGDKLHVLMQNTNSVYQFDLTDNIPWDLRFINDNSMASFDVTSHDNNNRGIFWKSNGTKVYTLGQQNNSIRQFPVSYPFDISTIGALEATFSVTGEQTQSTAITWKSDGTKVYVIGQTPATAFQYPVAFPWDISTAGASEASFPVGSVDTAPTGITWNDDGTKFYFSGNISLLLYQYSVSTPWDLSTVGALEATFDVSGDVTSIQTFVWKDNGTKFYFVGATNVTVFQYSVSTPFDLSTAGSLESSFDATSDVSSILRSIAWSSDGSRIHLIGSTNNTIFQYAVATQRIPPVPETAWNIRFSRPVEESFVFSSQSASTTINGIQQIVWKDDGTKLYMTSSFTDSIHQHPASIPFHVDSLGAEEAVFDISSEETNVQGMFWKNDGTKVYIIGQSSNSIHQYPVSTPWDISTAGSVEAFFDISSDDVLSEGIFWKPDGTKLWMIGNDTDSVFQYSAGTPWEVGTLSAAEAVFVVDTTFPTELWWKENGTKLFTIDLTGNIVTQYPVLVPWDISVVGVKEATRNIGSEEGTSRALTFNNDGTRMYVAGFVQNTVFQYSIG